MYCLLSRLLKSCFCAKIDGKLKLPIGRMGNVLTVCVLLSRDPRDIHDIKFIWLLPPNAALCEEELSCSSPTRWLLRILKNLLACYFPASKCISILSAAYFYWKEQIHEFRRVLRAEGSWQLSPGPQQLCGSCQALCEGAQAAGSSPVCLCWCCPQPSCTCHSRGRSRCSSSSLFTMGYLLYMLCQQCMQMQIRVHTEPFAKIWMVSDPAASIPLTVFHW